MKIISSFQFTFYIPNNEFSKTIEKSLKINFVENKEFFFEIQIPDYLYNYVKDKHPDYSDSTTNDAFKTRIKFHKFIRTQSFNDLKTQLTQMSQRAIFFKKISLMDEFNKVIFIKCNYTMNHIRDSYNFADLNNNYNLNFNYFVAYEIEENDFVKGRYKGYYGLKRYGDTQFRINNNGMLPSIHMTDLSQYIKIRWTQERKEFLEDTAQKIGKVSELINNYVKKINENNFEKIIEQQTKNKFLEYKEEVKQ